MRMTLVRTRPTHTTRTICTLGNRSVAAARVNMASGSKEPIAAPPNYNYQQTGTGLFYQTKERTSITAAAPDR